MNVIASLPSLPNGMVINGQRRAASDGRVHPTYDPASGETLTAVAVSSPSDVHEAVHAAKSALEGSWRKTTPAERGRILQRTANILRRDASQLARVESLDSGKPIREARGDVETSARYFEYYAGIADKLQGETIPLGPDFISLTLHEPVGVTGHIIPWNFPLVTTARGLGPAFAAGCTAVAERARTSGNRGVSPRRRPSHRRPRENRRRRWRSG